MKERSDDGMNQGDPDPTGNRHCTLYCLDHEYMTSLLLSTS
jgi:hypothetical protein